MLKPSKTNKHTLKPIKKTPDTFLVTKPQNLATINITVGCVGSFFIVHVLSHASPRSFPF